MLPELILREEEQENLTLLVLLGLLSGLAGFTAARALFPTQVDLLSVMFASVPLVFPLVSYFLERENESRPHLPEIRVYGSIFLGIVASFFILGLYRSEVFSLQKEIVGAAGQATDPGMFTAVLSNNLMVFLGILAVAAVIGSAGAFILTWNASVLGVFLAGLFQQSPVMPLAYIPHATLEMSGFIVAGVSGTIVSAAVYREHFEKDTWLDLAKLVVLGVALVFAGALLETA